MIEIRDVRVEDAEEILAILNPIIAARCYTALDTPVTVDQERDFIRTFPARGIFLAAVDTSSNRIAGFQNVSPFAGLHACLRSRRCHRHLRRSRTEAARHRHTALRGDIRSRATEGLREVLHLRARRQRGGTANLSRQGFRIVGIAERHAKIDGRYIDEIVIEKWLPPAGSLQ